MTILRIALFALFVEMLCAQQSVPGTLEGVVMRSVTNEPLSKVRVELRADAGSVQTTTTNAEGKFFLSNVRPGEYRLAAMRDSFVPAEYGQRHPGGPSLSIIVSSGQRITGLLIAMTPGGVISGRITDRGKPAGLVRVAAVRISYDVGQRVPIGLFEVFSNDLGEYRLFGLAPGHYYVAARVPDNGRNGVDVSFINPNGTDSSFFQQRAPRRFVFSRAITSGGVSDTEMHVNMFAPGTPDLQLARAIDVGPGDEIRGVDIKADPIPALHIRGTVTGIPPLTPAGTAQAPLRVNILSLSLLYASPDSGIRVDANGTFDVSRVSPGNYWLLASTGNVGGHVYSEVRDRDVNGVNVKLEAGVSVFGRAIIERQASNSPDPGIPGLRIGLARDTPGPVLRSNSIATPSPDGSFTIPVVPLGDHRVSVLPILLPQSASPATSTTPKALENVYVKSIKLGDADVLNDGLHLAAQPRDPLVITIGTNPGSLEGRVMNGNESAAAVTVVLIPESGQRFHVNHKFTFTDASGRFQIPGVPPGDYKLFAWESIEPGAWQDPDFVRDYESRGHPIHVNEGEKKAVAVSVIPAKL